MSQLTNNEKFIDNTLNLKPQNISNILNSENLTHDKFNQIAEKVFD